MPLLSTTIKKIKDLITGESKTYTLTQELSDCIESMENSNINLFITGKAGTGKSTLIEYFRNTTKKKTVVLAPTGLAAINVRGQTIHSFFHFPPHFTDPNQIPNLSNSRIYRDLDTIIIDEISMVRADIFDRIDKFLRVNGRDKNLPFGGIQMIVVGDLYQLPPIVTNNEKYVFSQFYESPYFFSSNVFSVARFSIIELSNIFRQKDEKYITLLNKVRTGQVTVNDLEMINERVVTKDYEKIRRYYITLATTNSVVAAINDSELNKINEPLFSYQAEIEGIFPTEEKVLPVELDLKLKKGARVIFVKNDKGRRWVNGTTGTIFELTKDTIKVKLDESGFHEIVTVDIEEWENIKYEYDEEKGNVEPIVLGKLKQYPIRLAWSITIHKSQGMTFDRANIDFSKSPFAHGQAYVALSRCRTIEGMVVTKKIYPNDVIVDPRVVSFSEKLKRM
jgi:ATP-dependent exoDNAse (exonuclease V) alpha subunit